MRGFRKERTMVSPSQQELFATVDSVHTSAEAARALFREVSCFPPFGVISNGELFSLSLSNKNANLTHGLHRFAAKYIPRVPAWALDEFAGKNDVVLDPFCGSGTTLIEALSRC